MDGCADLNEVECFLCSFEGYADASHGAGVGFDEAPVEAVGGAEFHPVSHGVASAGVGDAASVGLF